MTAWDEYGRYHVEVEVDCDRELTNREVANIEVGARAMVGANTLTVLQRVNVWSDCTCTCTCSCDHCEAGWGLKDGPPSTLKVRAWLVAQGQSGAEKDVRAAVLDVMQGESVVAA